MPNRSTTPLTWVLVAFFGLLYIAYLLQNQITQQTRSLHSLEPVLLGEINGTITPEPVAGSMAETTSKTMPSVHKTSSADKDQGPVDASLPTTEFSVNAPMSDEEINKSIAQKNQKRDTLKNVRADREKKAQEVLREAQASQIKSSFKKETAGSIEEPERAVAPADIVYKLQSNELIAH